MNELAKANEAGGQAANLLSDITFILGIWSERDPLRVTPEQQETMLASLAELEANIDTMQREFIEAMKAQKPVEEPSVPAYRQLRRRFAVS